MDSNESLIIEERKKKVISFLKNNRSWIVYLALAFIVFLALNIRTANLDGLRDATTNDWTLGPDLDPFLFLRYAKYIVEHGGIMKTDAMRYAPLGFGTSEEYLLLPYMMAWFHKAAVLFGSTSVDQSSVFFPVFMFGLTVVAFFLLTRKIFAKGLGTQKANIIALISSFFLAVMPSLLPRTIAGIPEKESAAFFFMFMALYFFISAWESDKKNKAYLAAALSAVFTAGMAFIWGGFGYIFLIAAPTVLAVFFFGDVDKRRTFAYTIWLFAAFAIMIFNPRYTLSNIFRSVTTGAGIFVLIVLAAHHAIWGTKLKKYFEKEKMLKVPRKVISLAVCVILISAASTAVFGASFIPSKLGETYNNLVKPATTRLIQTVAENKQPYFNEWAGNFGPQFAGFPVTFWLFFIGSIFLFNYLVSTFAKKERLILSMSYVVFLISLIFSRYSPESTFTGENTISILFYAFGFLLFVGSLGFYYWKYYREGRDKEFEKIPFGPVFLFVFFFLAIVSARGAIRLVMILVPPASIIIGYLAAQSGYYIKDSIKKENKAIAAIMGGIVILAVIFSAYSLYNASHGAAEGYVPAGYNQQWQKAMAWVRENTQENAVFGHWWDYGYWVQSIGNRATVLDGGNSISYWNHMMGRYALTGPSAKTALEFLYAHNTTHFLIDSTDIGKYSAFSNIGSDESYDRASWISTFVRDNSQTVERKNSTIEIYGGGTAIDEDIIYSNNGSEIFLPGQKAGLGAIIVEVDNQNVIKSVSGIFVYQDQQYSIPLRYYYDGETLFDAGEGLKAGVFFMPKLNLKGEQANVEQRGALLYLSSRTVNSQLARLYLYDEKNTGFRLAHAESDIIVESLRSQGLSIGEFIFFEGLRGPIKIWEINYPADIKFNEEFISTDYPESLRNA